MAGPYSSNLYDTLSPTRTNTSRLINPAQQSGKVEFAQCSYTLLGTEAATEIINLLELPKGAIVIPQLSSVACADPGTTLTLDIGEAADPDGIADGIILSSGGLVSMASTTSAYRAPTPLTVDTGEFNTTIYATVDSANTLSASVVLYFVIAWKSGR